MNFQKRWLNSSAALTALVALALLALGAAEKAAPQDAKTTKPPQGIAKKYPADKGIEKDPAVLFHEDFETGNFRKWDRQWRSKEPDYNIKMGVSKTPEAVHTGKYGMAFDVPPGGSNGGFVTKWLKGTKKKPRGPGFDVVYARVYWKLAAPFNVDNMHGFGITAQAEWLKNIWAGVRADGKNKFSANVDYPHKRMSLYVYNPEQATKWGEPFVTKFRMTPGRWYSVEIMQKANTPGKRDGEQAIWVDGKLIKRWTGLRLRDVPELRINQVHLNWWIHNNIARNRMYYDDLVVATKYIGPRTGPRKTKSRKE